MCQIEFIFQSARVWLEDGWFEMENAGTNSFTYKGICACMETDGTIYVSGEKEKNASGIYAVQFAVENTFFQNALVLEDAWERGYGDLKWEKPDGKKQLPWYFAAHEDGKSFCFGVKTLPNAMCFWQCGEEEISLCLDLRNGTRGLMLEERRLAACKVVTMEAEGTAYEAVCAFCEKMCDAPRRVETPVFGGNDWYCNYGNNSFEKILLHTERIVECAKGCAFKPYMVVDDGWEFAYNPGDGQNGSYNGGPWKYCNRKFGDMKKMAEAIEAAGAIPGIWIRPLETSEYVPEEYALRTGHIKKTLDPSHPGVLDMVKEDIRTLKEWGYKLIKHDFSTFDIWNKWGFEVTDELALEDICFYDRTKTTAEIIKQFYLTIREAAGDDVMVMGCNTISHLSAGIFELQRTGDDTSGVDWERTRKYGVNTLAFRMPQHKRFYLADADCVGITRSIEWRRNRQWLDVLAKSSTPLFVSIAEDAYTEEIKADIADAFRKNSEAQQISVPLDWMENARPECWESVYGVDHYRW